MKRYKETKNRKKLKKIRSQKQAAVAECTRAEGLHRWWINGFRRCRDLVAANPVRWGKASVLLLIPAVLLLTSFLLTEQSAAALLWPFTHGGAFGLGWVVILGAVLLLYGIAGRLWAAWLGTAIPCLLVSLVNLYKMELHGAPLMMNDFTLIGEFGIIAGYAMPNLKFSLLTVVVLLLSAGLPVLLWRLDRRIKARRYSRLFCASAGFLLAVLAVLVFPGSALPDWAVMGAKTHTERVENAGILVGIYGTWAADRTMEDDVDLSVLKDSLGNLDESESAPTVSELSGEQTSGTSAPEESVQPEEPVPTPTVIFLMAESFFDITEIPTLSFETDPIPVFHAVEETSVSGKLISNTYCGGTGYVEMEVLTGICSYLLKESDTLTSLPFEVYDAMPCISDVFDRYGYRMEFIHSHNNALYNRETIYQSFGFDSVRFSDSFAEDAGMSGGYVSDMSLSEEIIAAYENRGEEPLMLYTVSMENHQPYFAAKYPTPSGAGTASDMLTEEDLGVVDSYVQGLMNADRAMGRLIDYFSAQENPVMIVFWGDHLPNLKLSDGSSAFEKLQWCSTGLTTQWEPEELQRMLSTDYFIWTNYDLTLEDAPSSSTMLGLTALKALNFELTDYFRWLDKNVAPEYLMYRPRLFVDSQWNAMREIPESAESTMKIYRAAVYNMVYGEQDLFTAYRVAVEEGAP